MTIVQDLRAPDKTEPPAGRGLPFIPWYPGAFMTSTRGWPVTARGVYRELLDAEWDSGALPTDPSELRRLIGATRSEWRIGWAHVEAKFPIGPDGLRRNARLEQHRQHSQHLSELRAEIGRRGGAASAASRRRA